MNASLRDLVRRRAANRCEYCRLPQTYAPIVRFHVEHIRARQHEGGDDAGNLSLACPRCNAYKGPNLTSIDPQTNEVVPIFNPRSQSWVEHFAIEGVRIVGLSPTGRATVRLLNMNAEERLKVRLELQDRGEL